jgi:hypothetical protein
MRPLIFLSVRRFREDEHAVRSVLRARREAGEDDHPADRSRHTGSGRKRLVSRAGTDIFYRSAYFYSLTPGKTLDETGPLPVAGG